MNLLENLPDFDTEAAAVIAVATQAALPQQIVGNIYALTEGAVHVDLTDEIQSHNPRPQRRKGTVAVTDAESLSRLVLDLGPEHGSTRIYADILGTTPTISAVLNDHDASPDDETDAAGWGDHRVVLEVRRTPAWKAWRDHDRKMLGQVEFAQHLEDNLRDIAAPDGADLLEMALTFEQTTSAEFRSAVRLNTNTRQLTYVETADQQAGKTGQMTIPEWITLRLAPFEGAEEIQVEARLRTSARDGKLAIGYRIDRVEEIERNALDSIVDEIETATELTAYRAKPPTR